MHREDPMLRIDFLFVDLSTCTRCRGAHRDLESALEVARDVLASAGTEVEVDRIHILDAILREVYGGSVVKRARHPEPYDQPENLEPFCAGKAAAPIPTAAGRCSPAEQSSCCEAEDRAECCGTATGTAYRCR
jgi:hypothetical protein